MKKFFSLILIFCCMFAFVSCGAGQGSQAIELMGAGDRIHDSFTFANTGVEIKSDGENSYTISGSVEKFDNSAVREEFDIEADVTHVVAIKLTAIDTDVVKEEVEISVDGDRSYDAEHLNGSDYTFIILEAIAGDTTVIKVKWNSNAEEKVYTIHFAENLILK